MSSELAAVGIDIGSSGGFAMVSGREILMASQFLGEKIAKQELEGTHKKVPKKCKKKRDEQGNLLPTSMTIFSGLECILLLEEAKRIAKERGYAGIQVVVEEPQTFIGRSSPSGYFVTGGCYHTWAYALHTGGIRWGVVPPAHWKAGMKITKQKSYSITRTVELTDNANEIRLSPKKVLTDDHNVCEAVLLALWLQDYTP